MPDTTVAHQFDDSRQQHDAASLGMWLFLATEVLFFGAMFTAYAIYRWQYPRAFAAGSGDLDLLLGTVNTAVLLTSSLSMALAVRSAQTARARPLVWMLLATMGLGVLFLVIKGFEYAAKLQHHLFPGVHFQFAGPEPAYVELFFVFYFFMTAVHALHLGIGIVVLGCLLRPAQRARYSAEYFAPVEVVGLYWHFVDIVWIFLFPFLYLIR